MAKFSLSYIIESNVKLHPFHWIGKMINWMLTIGLSSRQDHLKWATIVFLANIYIESTDIVQFLNQKYTYLLEDLPLYRNPLIPLGI